MRQLLLVIITVMTVTVLSAQQAGPAQAPPPLPTRDETTLVDLKVQLADCNISSAAQRRYEDKLVARIRELEAQLKAQKQ